MRREYACDCAFLNSGNIRADKQYSSGHLFTMGDLYDLIAFEVPIVKLKMSGTIILSALQNSVSKWPELEGRFLQVSGIRLEFDPSKAPGSRIIEETVRVAGEPLDLERVYTVATADYLMFGKEGYDDIKKAKVLIDEENGVQLKQIIHKFSRKPNPITKPKVSSKIRKT